MNQSYTITDRILTELSAHPEITTKEQFHSFKNAIYAEYKLPRGIPGIALINRYNILISEGILEYEPRIWKLLRKRAVRSLSGVSIISILTKPWGCPGKCIYCPNYEGLPKSYIPNEPAVMRAELNEFDAMRQIWNRLRSLEITGHRIDKCDARIIGGTWSVYSIAYQEEYMKDLYDAFTLYPELRKNLISTNMSGEKFASFEIRPDFVVQKSATLEEAKKRNETAECRVIGIAIETRPDVIDEDEITRLRGYGVTRVEIGYQSTDDMINKINKRGHGNAESIRATRLLKDAGFKVVAHMMPNLLGSTPEKDLASLREVFKNPDFRPDELKIYPMMVTPHTELEGIWRGGGFVPYDDKALVNLMAEMQGIIPEYVRLNRMYRDIPSTEILAGSHLANLRQITDQTMQERGIIRKDISAREIREKGNNPADAVLDVTEYEASGGTEYFLQWIDPVDRTVFSLLRLRITKDVRISEKGGNSRENRVPERDVLKSTMSEETEIGTGSSHFAEIPVAIIRELHTFGDQLRVGEKSDGTGQHMGFGKRLMERTEEIVHEKYPEIKKIAVIAGVGVRAYYEKLGYELEGEYMVKKDF